MWTVSLCSMVICYANVWTHPFSFTKNQTIFPHYGNRMSNTMLIIIIIIYQFLFFVQFVCALYGRHRAEWTNCTRYFLNTSLAISMNHESAMVSAKLRMVKRRPPWSTSHRNNANNDDITMRWQWLLYFNLNCECQFICYFVFVYSSRLTNNEGWCARWYSLTLCEQPQSAQHKIHDLKFYARALLWPSLNVFRTSWINAHSLRWPVRSHPNSGFKSCFLSVHLGPLAHNETNCLWLLCKSLRKRFSAMRYVGRRIFFFFICRSQVN